MTPASHTHLLHPPEPAPHTVHLVFPQGPATLPQDLPVPCTLVYLLLFLCRITFAFNTVMICGFPGSKSCVFLQVKCVSSAQAIEGTWSMLTNEGVWDVSLLGLFYFRCCVYLKWYSLLLREPRVLVIELSSQWERGGWWLGQGLCP